MGNVAPVIGIWRALEIRQPDKSQPHLTQIFSRPDIARGVWRAHY